MFLYAKEKEDRIAAEKQREADRQRFEEQLQEDRRRFEEQLQEERRRSEETHQAILAALSALTDKITELAGPNRDNGR